jgi:hypothetical protein
MPVAALPLRTSTGSSMTGIARDLAQLLARFARPRCSREPGGHLGRDVAGHVLDDRDEHDFGVLAAKLLWPRPASACSFSVCDKRNRHDYGLGHVTSTWANNLSCECPQCSCRNGRPALSRSMVRGFPQVSGRQAVAM